MDGLTSWFEYVVKNYDDILEAFLQHVQIVLVVIGLATVFSVTLGIFVQRNASARALALSIAGIFLTIPSLARRRLMK